MLIWPITATFFLGNIPKISLGGLGFSKNPVSMSSGGSAQGVVLAPGLIQVFVDLRILRNGGGRHFERRRHLWNARWQIWRLEWSNNTLRQILEPHFLIYMDLLLLNKNFQTNFLTVSRLGYVRIKRPKFDLARDLQKLKFCNNFFSVSKTHNEEQGFQIWWPYVK